jgi:hypothetical protein
MPPTTGASTGSPDTMNLSTLSAFRADDSLVEIIPQFTLAQPLLLHSCSKAVGPWQAGIPTTVPLWLACHLQIKRLCTLPTPTWLSVTNLAHILSFERKESILWRDASRLPHDYYQIAQRMSLEPAVQLLVKDLWQVRMDKLRQQFQDLLRQQQEPTLAGGDDYENNADVPPPPLVVEITGMGSAEIALLQKTVQRALRDQDKLRHAARRTAVDKVASSDPPTVSSPTTEKDYQDETVGVTPPSATHARVPLRRFR